MIRTVLADIRVNKLRSFLTGISMLIGVLVLVGITAASAVVEDAFVASVEQRTGREGSFVRILETTDLTQAQEVNDAVQARLGQHTPVRPEVESNQVLLTAPSAPPDTDTMALQVTWTSGDLADFHRRPILEGTTELGVGLPPRLILNRTAAVQTGLRVGDAVWTALHYQAPAQKLVVSGIIEDAGAEPRGWASWSTLEGARPSTEQLGGLQVRMVLPPSSSAAASLAVDSLLQSRGLSELPEPLQRVDEVGELQDNLATLQTVFVGVAITSLAVSALGLLNIGLASLAERARELVIRRALGARRIHTFVQVIGSSLILAVLVAAVATAICLAVIYWGVPHWLPEHSPVTAPSVPWEALVVGLAAAAATAVLGSVFPAWKATRLPVADALRQ